MTAAAGLVVWRHGRTEWNDSGRFQGQLDPPLDGVGHAQAAGAAAALAALRPGAVVSSDLLRARETAAYLAGAAGAGVGVVCDRRLREIDVGEWGGLTRAEIELRFPGTYAAWLRGEDVRREGGESFSDVLARVSSCLADLLAGAGAGVPRDGAGPLVLVTHGGTSRAVVLSLLGLPVTAWASFGALGNARWAAFEHRPSGWRLTAYNVGAEPAAAAPGRDDASPEPVL